MPNAIWKKIASGKVDAVYLLTGVEHHIFDATIERLKKALPEIDDASVVRFDLEETPVEAVIEEADTLPFLQDHKLIIANHAVFLSGQDKKRAEVDHNLTVLEQWLENPSPTATVVFIAPYEKLDGRKRITKKMRDLSTVIEANRLEGKDLLTWIQHEAKTNGSHISSAAAQTLMNTVGDNLLSLATEIRKMATYLGENGEITNDLIEMLVPRTPEMDVFRLTDAYVASNIPKTVSIYHDLLRSGEEPIMLTSLIAGQIRLMIHVQSLRKKGYQQQQIAKALHVHPYRVKLMLENRRIPNESRLLQILKQLADIDYKLKTTSGKRERLLELFFMDSLQQRR
ncbi:DNA polymerase III subunit delta [Sporosarcina ureilytica]|uniref:DNA polymerase III subunit delta n=1 Tax=Sporosarcina ureilytica TaxID=298596 RepID=A0A1D8JGS1_9BACL|nr:DNA polymerase III subunit delta [Sporosarcina ureilytica]AOV07919.1 DNA polymerase III subunit delta [Sporosarcina ureilytica]